MLTKLIGMVTGAQLPLIIGGIAIAMSLSAWTGYRINEAKWLARQAEETQAWAEMLIEKDDQYRKYERAVIENEKLREEQVNETIRNITDDGCSIDAGGLQQIRDQVGRIFGKTE